MSDLKIRIAKLEKSNPGKSVKEIVADFWRNADARASRLSEDLAAVTEEQRMTWPLVEHVAWKLRFEGDVDLDYVASLYRWTGVPTTWASWALFINCYPFDMDI